MSLERLESADVDGKTALVRVDFNVPRDDSGAITDMTRVEAALPTIRALREGGARVVLLAHYGRPKGMDPALSLKFLVEPLSDLLGEPVGFGAGSDAGVVLLENTRFEAGETEGDAALAKRWASLGDLFVADAFSAAHRAHASVSGIADYLPAYAGLAMERELDHIGRALDAPERPVMAIVGGAKVSTKIGVLEHLVTKLDVLVIGGGMANTFLLAMGHPVGKSLAEPDFVETANRIMAAATRAGCELVLPLDVVVAKDFKAHAESRVSGVEDVAPDEMILDAGPATVDHIMDKMERANTLIWNGPLGAFEMPPFDTSTVEAAKYAAKLTRANKLVSVAGGGDTVAALSLAGAADDFTFVSTAGGAFLEWMEGKPLPGVEILKH